LLVTCRVVNCLVERL